MNIIRGFILATLSGLSLATFAESNCIPFPIDIGERPESVTKAFDGDYFVSVMNKKEPADGVIVRMSETGKITTFATGFDEPKGLAFVGDTLYVSDLQKVWRIDRAGKASVLVDSKDFPNPSLYLNDIAVAPDGENILITDMGAVEFMRDKEGALWPLTSLEATQVPAMGRLYQITPKGEVSLLQDYSTLMLNPNGVGVSQTGQVFVGDFFTGNLLELKEGKLIALPGTYRGIDGIEKDSKGNIYVSSWTQGILWKISKDANITELKVGLKSAADFYLDEKNNRILLPDMLTGLIHEVKI